MAKEIKVSGFNPTMIVTYGNKTDYFSKAGI